MVEILYSIISLLKFIANEAPLLINTLLATIIIYILSDSIRRYATIYYCIFSIPMCLGIIQICFFTNYYSYNLYEIFFIGPIIYSYIHMVDIGYPLLIIVMYMGALDPRNTYVKKFMSIRKEISILCGFPIILHTLVRIISALIKSLKYLFYPSTINKEEISSMLGFIMYRSGYILGIVMTILFLILWITSFDFLQKKLGKKTWHKIHNWSYLLYALLFIHSILLNVGWYIDDVDYKTPYQYMFDILAVILIFTSYLYLRLRKASSDKKRRMEKRKKILKLSTSPN